MLLIIHDVALPQTIRTISFRIVAHEFQKCSSALTNLEHGVSSHGNSSRKTTFFPSPSEYRCLASNANASDQFFGFSKSCNPAEVSESANVSSCSFLESLCFPVCETQIYIRKLLESSMFSPHVCVHTRLRIQTCHFPKAIVIVPVLFFFL